jgi:hypothetical protein
MDDLGVPPWLRKPPNQGSGGGKVLEKAVSTGLFAHLIASLKQQQSHIDLWKIHHFGLVTVTQLYKA